MTTDPPNNESVNGKVPNFIKEPNIAMLGAETQIDAVVERIRASLKPEDDGKSKEPYVVGLYGEWGSGKSFWLEHIQYKLIEKTIDDKDVPLIIPVFFNAWRFEKEEHLIIPLLKTTVEELARWQKHNKDWKSGLEKLGKEVLYSSAALAYAFAKNLDKTGILTTLEEADKTAKSIRGRFSSRFDRVQEKSRKLDSRYFDFHNALQEALGVKIGEFQRPLRLLFLIDDLDRCLPEKAIEMLEAIKLFLEVEGTAFVVAVDDEVVERGILYRYRHTQTKEESSPPITGHEYLEKIIHLPVRLDRPLDPTLIHDFIEEKCSVLDDLKQDTESSTPVEEEENPTLQKQERPDHNGDNLAQHYQQVLACIPAVPRKLIRLSELFGLRAEVLCIESVADKLLLLRVVAMQLFAPEVYRLAAKNLPQIFSTMHEWEQTYKDDYPDFNAILASFEPTAEKEEKHKEKGENENTASRKNRLNLKDLAIFKALARLQAQRAQFELVNLVTPETQIQRVGGPWRRFYEKPRPREDSAERELKDRPSTKTDSLKPTLRLPATEQREFVEQLLSDSPSAWREVTGDKLEWDMKLGSDIVNSLLSGLASASKLFNEAHRWEWLAIFGAYLTPEQIQGAGQALNIDMEKSSLKKIMESDRSPEERQWAADVLSYLGDDRDGVGVKSKAEVLVDFKNLKNKQPETA